MKPTTRATILVLCIGAALGSGCVRGESDPTRPEARDEDNAGFDVDPCALTSGEEVEQVMGIEFGVERHLWRDGELHCQRLQGSDVLGHHDGWSELSVDRDPTSVQEREKVILASVERVDGIGERGYWSAADEFAGMSAVVAGAWMSLQMKLPDGATFTADHRARAIALARNIVTRLETRLRGDPARLPRRAEPPADPCSLATREAQQHALGWSTSTPRSGETAGGPFGGEWFCWWQARQGQVAIDITKQAVASGDFERVGSPVDGVGRPAKYRPPARQADRSIAVPAAIAFLTDDSRAVVIELTDHGRDDAGHRNALVVLARNAASVVG